MDIDRRAFIASLGGASAVALMTSEQKADALEAYMEESLDAAVAAGRPGAGAEVSDDGGDRGAERQAHGRAPRRRQHLQRDRPRREAARPAAEDVGPADAARVLREALRAGQPRAAERDARAQDRHARRDHPRLSDARHRARAREGRSRLVGRADHRAVRLREGRRLPSATIRRCASIRTRSSATSTPRATCGRSARTTSRSRISSRTTSGSATTSGTTCRAW